MAHVHEDGKATYHLEQLCTIGICAALGGVTVLLYTRGLLTLILATKFHVSVLVGGIVLLMLAAIRAVTLWAMVRSRQGHAHAHDHEHEPGHEVHHSPDEVQACDHDHDCAGTASGHAHSHGEGDDHGHDHGWSPWRYTVLLLPIVLFFLDMPNRGFSAFKPANMGGLEESHPVQDRGGEVLTLDFKELERAAYNQEARAFYEGRMGRLRGQFSPSPNDKKFTLVRMKITCCVADMIQMRVVIDPPTTVTHVSPGDWVEVEGQIQFWKRGDDFVPVVKVKSNDQIKKIPPDPNLYVQ